MTEADAMNSLMDAARSEVRRLQTAVGALHDGAVSYVVEQLGATTITNAGSLDEGAILSSVRPKVLLYLKNNIS